MVSEPRKVFGVVMHDIFTSNLFNFGLVSYKKFISFNKHDSETRPAIGWISVKRADKDVSRGAGPQSSSGRFPSAHHY